MAEAAIDTSRQCTAFFTEDGSFTGLKTTDIGSSYTFKVAEVDGSTALVGIATFDGAPSFQHGSYDVNLGGSNGEDIIITISDQQAPGDPVIVSAFKKQDNSLIVKAEMGVGHVLYKSE
ncbi:hypothetical protein RSOLAG1IB_05955 [Rhizoctonia solani AG-1 IB]|uniref:Uncharacterized protein n=1 Tax=Thanatephorus cucumeris (strain AG1-IB / isolate 7/3/14) TaxID=1108050 RepID=A0A0B7F9H4_THACB|nr:hypothetical protein RSOLAG1IB_05955 [Rhizoctonia solani AG-1 IB]